MSSTFIKKETINRLLKDIKNIIKNPLSEHGIYYTHDELDMLKGYALIIGPENTPYFGGFYFFEFNYPTDYPYSPPKVKYFTNSENIRFNPNLYTCGKICISILNTWKGDQWTSCQTISTVLLTLCSLLCTNPLLNEPGVTEYHKDIKNYNNIIEYSNINIAICDMIYKNPNVFLPQFNIFYSIIKENFLLNYNKHIQFIENKIKEFPNDIILTTSLYKMEVNIKYNNLLKKLQNYKDTNII
jgi:ubiquitin-conjugating enzyme E2 Z